MTERITLDAGNVVEHTKAYLLDLGERAFWTFVQAFIAAFTFVGLPMDGATLKTALYSAAAAGGAAVLSLLKSALAGLKTGTASTSTTVAQTAVYPVEPHTPEHAA